MKRYNDAVTNLINSAKSEGISLQEIFSEIGKNGGVNAMDLTVEDVSNVGTAFKNAFGNNASEEVQTNLDVLDDISGLNNFKQDDTINEERSEIGGIDKSRKGFETGIKPENYVENYPYDTQKVVEEKNSSKKSNDLFKKLIDSIPLLENDNNVYTVTGKEFEPGEKKLSQQVYEYFESLGGVVHRENFGDVVINDKGVDSSIAHGIGRAKAITFASVPAVIEKGRQIDFVKNWKGRNYSSYVFAAPINIGTQRAYVGVVVTKSGTDNRYYLHEVSDNKGNIIIIKKDDVSFKSKSEVADDSNSLGETSSSNRVSQNNDIVNNNFANDNTGYSESGINNDISSNLPHRVSSENVKRYNDAVTNLINSAKSEGISLQEIFSEIGKNGGVNAMDLTVEDVSNVGTAFKNAFGNNASEEVQTNLDVLDDISGLNNFKQDDTINEERSEINGVDTSRENIENGQGYSEVQTEVKTEGIFKERAGNVDSEGKIDGIRERRIETRNIETLTDYPDFQNIKKTIGDDIPDRLFDKLSDKYENDPRLDEGYDFSDVVVYDMLADENNELRERFSDSIDEYFNTDKSVKNDSTGKRLSDSVINKTRESVVRNSHGQLIPMYHGTDKAYPVLLPGDVGIHFGSYSQAKELIKSKNIENPVYIKAYLDVKNPLVIEEDSNGWNAAQIASLLEKNNIITHEQVREFFYPGISKETNQKLVELLRSKGYDGIKYTNQYEAGSGTSYIVFDDSQIIRASLNNEDAFSMLENGVFDAEKEKSLNSVLNSPNKSDIIDKNNKGGIENGKRDNGTGTQQGRSDNQSTGEQSSSLWRYNDIAERQRTADVYRGVGERIRRKGKSGETVTYERISIDKNKKSSHHKLLEEQAKKLGAKVEYGLDIIVDTASGNKKQAFALVQGDTIVVSYDAPINSGVEELAHRIKTVSDGTYNSLYNTVMNNIKDNAYTDLITRADNVYSDIYNSDETVKSDVLNEEVVCGLASVIQTGTRDVSEYFENYGEVESAVNEFFETPVTDKQVERAKVKQMSENSPKKFLKSLSDFIPVPKTAKGNVKRSISKEAETKISDIRLEYTETGQINETKSSELFDFLYKSSVVENIGQYDDALNYLKNTKMYISPTDKASITDFNKFRQSMFNKLDITTDSAKGGVLVDVAFMEFNDLFPGLLDGDITHPAEQLQAFAEFTSTAKEKQKMTIDEYFGSTAENVRSQMQEMFDESLKDYLEGNGQEIKFELDENGNSEQYKVMWTIEEGLASKRDIAEFYSLIGKYKEGVHKPIQTYDGDLYETTNNLFFTDSDYLKPTIFTVISFNTEDVSIINQLKEAFIDVITTGRSIDSTCQTYENIVEEGLVTRTDITDSQAYQRSKNNRGKRRGGKAVDRENQRYVTNTSQNTTSSNEATSENDVAFSLTEALDEISDQLSVKKVKMSNFPPYNKSHSNANEIATRWAHLESVKTGTQTFVFYHNNCYVIEKFDSNDLGYQIIGKTNYDKYKEIYRRVRNGRNKDEQSTVRGINNVNKRNRQRSPVKSEEYGIDGNATEHGRESGTIYGVVGNQDGKRQITNNGNRDNEQNITNREIDSTLDIRYSVDSDEGSTEYYSNRYNELLEKYGAIKKGENSKKEAFVPKRSSDNMLVSEHARTIAESGLISA